MRNLLKMAAAFASGWVIGATALATWAFRHQLLTEAQVASHTALHDEAIRRWIEGVTE